MGLSTTYTKVETDFLIQQLEKKHAKSQTILVASKDASNDIKLISNYVCDGIDDDIKINAAIQDISLSRGGTVRLSEGRFSLSSPIIIDRALSLVGSGRGIKLSLDNPATSDDMRGTAVYQTTNTDVIKIETPNKLQGFEIKDMLLVGYGRQNNPVGHGIHIAGGSDVSVMRNLSISDCYAGIFYNHDVTTPMLDTPWIDQCSIQRNHVGVLAIGGHLMRITNNIFWENYGIESYGGYDFNCGGIAIQGLGNHIIANNHFGENNFLEGSNSSKNSSHLSIVYSNPIVTGNVFNDIQGNAIKLTEFASYCKISNNQFNGFGKGLGLTDAQRAGIYIEGSQSNVISDNYMKSFEGTYAIYENYTSFKNTFLNNIFQDLINNTANRIFSEGTDTFESGTVVRPDLLPEKYVLVGDVNQGVDGVKNFAKRTNFHENIVVGDPGLTNTGLDDLNGNLQCKTILLRENDLTNGIILRKHPEGELGEYDLKTFKNSLFNGVLHLQRTAGSVGIGTGTSSTATGKKLDVGGNVAIGAGVRFDPGATLEIADVSPQVQVSRAGIGNNAVFYLKNAGSYIWFYGMLSGSNDYVIGQEGDGKDRFRIIEGSNDADIKINGNTGVISITGTATAITAPTGTNTTQIANTEFVQQEILPIDERVEFLEQQTGNILKNIRLTVEGDSIMEQGFVTSKIVSKTECILTNNAKSGSGFVQDIGTGTIRSRASAIASSNPDVILIAGGTNDYSNSIPIGSPTVLNDDTQFYSAVYNTFRVIREQNPTVPILVCTPITRNPSNTEPRGHLINGKSLRDFADALIWCANQFSIEICDLNYISGITYENIDYTTSDGVHVNNIGGELMAVKIVAQLRNLAIF